MYGRDCVGGGGGGGVEENMLRWRGVAYCEVEEGKEDEWQDHCMCMDGWRLQNFTVKKETKKEYKMYVIEHPDAGQKLDTDK